MTGAATPFAVTSAQPNEPSSPRHPLRYLSTLRFGDDFLDRLRAVSPALSVQQVPAAAAADIPTELWAQVEVLHTSGVLPPAGAAPALRWVQLDTSGVDHVRSEWLWHSDIAITTLGGVGPVAMAEYVMFSVLGLAHRLPALVKSRRRRRWPAPADSASIFTPLPVRGTTMVILGYGRIGQEVARLAVPFGIRVVGVTRTGVTEPAAAEHRYDGRWVASRPAALTVRAAEAAGAVTSEDGAVTVVGQDRLDEALGVADWVVVVLPRTPETIGLINAARLATFKPGAVLVNASRGGIVDEGALLDCLRRGTLGGAMLDVFDSEPLGAESAWWREPGVFLTPHVAGLTPDYAAHVEHIVTENLSRFLAGRPLLNVVDRAKGY